MSNSMYHAASLVVFNKICNRRRLGANTKIYRQSRSYQTVSITNETTPEHGLI